MTLPSPQDVTINPDPASAVGVTIHKHEEKLKAIRGSPNWTSSACPPSRLFARAYLVCRVRTALLRSSCRGVRADGYRAGACAAYRKASTVVGGRGVSLEQFGVSDYGHREGMNTVAYKASQFADKQIAAQKAEDAAQRQAPPTHTLEKTVLVQRKK